jgi:hypothetical protein
VAIQPPGFRIEGNVMRFSVDKHDTQLIGFCADFAHEFSLGCRRSSGRTSRSLRQSFVGFHRWVASPCITTTDEWRPQRG